MKAEYEQLSLEEKMDLAENTAKNFFRQGLNCAECVTQTYLMLYDTGFGGEINALATGFGGGMGHTKNTCGAVTGAVLALGMTKGRKDPFAKESMAERIQEVNECYVPFGNMIKEMKEEYGTLICSELSDPFGEWEGKTRKKNCMSIIGYCARMAVKYTEQA